MFIGARLALNDPESTELLAGMSHDIDYDSQSVIIEASRRVGDDWKINLDGRFFSSDDPLDLSYSIKQDNHLQLTVERYF